MVNMVPHEAFACSCAEGDVVLRRLYRHESCASETFWMWILLWKETRLRQLMSSPGAPSSGHSTPPNYSSGPSTPPSYSLGPSTPLNYSLGSLKNAECSNCKHLAIVYVSRWESFVYNLDILREQFVGLVIQRGLPFNHFDDEKITRVFQNHMQPKYKHRVIAFEDFLVPHTGDALARMLRKVFVNFNLEDKIMSITLDNASNNTSAIATLNPCYNVQGVEFLIESISMDLDFFDDSYATTAKKVHRLVRSGGGGSSLRASHGNQVTTLLRRLEEHKNKKARSDPSLSSEYERYVHSDFVTHLQTTKFETFDVLGFWKAKETMFPVLSCMSMDILSVQATLVAFESVFSTSRRVLSI
nr:hAT family dimerisation domain containing protein [Tanacetum cinerariifolium]